eukprot:1079901-Pyramimonas_sp.AAC.1
MSRALCAIPQPESGRRRREGPVHERLRLGCRMDQPAASPAQSPEEAASPATARRQAAEEQDQQPRERGARVQAALAGLAG